MGLDLLKTTTRCGTASGTATRMTISRYDTVRYGTRRDETMHVVGCRWMSDVTWHVSNKQTRKRNSRGRMGGDDEEHLLRATACGAPGFLLARAEGEKGLMG